MSERGRTTIGSRRRPDARQTLESTGLESSRKASVFNRLRGAVRIGSVLLSLSLAMTPAFQTEADEASDLEERLAQLSGTDRLPLMTSLVRLYEDRDAERTIALALEGLELVGTEAAYTLVEIDLLLALAKAHFHTNANQEALRYAERSEAIAQTEGAESKQAAALALIGSIHARLDDAPRALEALRRAEDLYQRLGDTAAQAAAARSFGVVYFRQGDYTRAAEKFVRARELYANVGDELGEARALSNIGSVKSRIWQFETALTAFQESLAIYRRLDPSRIPAALNNIGLVHHRAEDPAQAVDYFRRAIEAMEDGGNERHLGHMHNNLGMSLADLGDFQPASMHLLRSLEIKERLGDRRDQAETLINLAGIHRMQDDWATALAHAERARDLALAANSPADLENAYSELTMIYSELGRHREALEVFLKHREIETEVYNAQNNRMIAEMTARYDSERKQREIERLEHRRRLDALELERQQSRQRVVIASSLAFITLVLGLAYTAWQRRTFSREREVNRRLREVDKLKDEFLANTSHELRTPLYGITGLAESLIDGAKGKLPSEVTADLSMIAGSGRRLGQLVNDILDHSRIVHGSLSLRRQPVDLRSLVEVVITLQRQLTLGKELELRNSVPADLPAADADEARLEQILHNLIGNAVKFTEEGYVEVSAKATESGVEVVVEDTGIGIAKEHQEMIFEAFSQASSGVQRAFGGTGLGLTVTRDLVELHGGDLRVDSTLGSGTRFTLTLPISNQETEASSLSVSRRVNSEPAGVVEGSRRRGARPSDTFQADTLRAGSILVVDDEPINRQVVSNHLTSEGYEVTTASGGSQALKLTEERSFDLIILDVMMPRMSGYEVCRSLRERHTLEDMPVIFLTAKSQVLDLVSGLEVGANDYLTKPLAKNELLARVRTHLELLDVHRSLGDLVSEKVSEIKVLKGLLPICAGCKRIRDEGGDWTQLELFIDRHSEATFSHGMCPDCIEGVFEKNPELRPETTP